MEIALDAEQRMFGQVAYKLAQDVADRWESGRDPETAAVPLPEADDWARIVNAGWLAMGLDEAHGGAGGTCVDVCVLVEQLGRHATPAPVIGPILLLEQLRSRGADPKLTEAIAAGELCLSPTFTRDLCDFATEPTNAIAVDVACSTGALVVSDSATEYKLRTAHTGADLTRQIAELSSLAREASQLSPVETESNSAALAFALTVISADLLGTMQGALDSAVDHVRSREQFGAPLGTFQAVQHMAAECLVSVEATRSAVWHAAWAVGELSGEEALRAARATKAFAAESAVDLIEVVIQLLGGIGMTWESKAHIWQRRIHLDRKLLGDEHHQYRILAQA